MTTEQTDSLVHNLATMLFAMQQIVLADAQQNGGQANPERVYGKIVAAHWGAVRGAIGLAGKWATLDDTKKALKDKLAGVPVPARPDALSGAMDLDMAMLDPVAGMCTSCGSMEPRGPMGECAVCGAPPG